MFEEVRVRERKSVKHGKTYEYRFETAPVGGERKWISKGGFLSEEEAKQAGIEAWKRYCLCGLSERPSDISTEEALEYLKLCRPAKPDEDMEEFQNQLDVISDLYLERPEVKDEAETDEGLTAAEFLDGLPVVPGLSVEAYLKELFGNQGISSEDILEQLGQELGVSTEAALEQLRKAYETAEKEDKPLRLLNR